MRGRRGQFLHMVRDHDNGRRSRPAACRGGRVEQHLHRGQDLLARQDIQAGGKLTMATISGLELMVKELRTDIGNE